MAALVSSIDPAATVVDLVNLDPERDRTVIVQAGAFAEHTIEDVRHTACEDGSWLGDLYDYGHGEPAVIERHTEVGGAVADRSLARLHPRAADLEAGAKDREAVLRETP